MRWGVQVVGYVCLKPNAGARRFAPAEVRALLADLGFRDTSAFEEVSGGDLLQLSQDEAELARVLALSPLQVGPWAPRARLGQTLAGAGAQP
jgi:hypothetical protein